MKALCSRNSSNHDSDDIDEILSKDVNNSKKRNYLSASTNDFFDVPEQHIPPDFPQSDQGNCVKSHNLLEISNLACPALSALDLSRRDSESELIRYLMAKGGRVDSDIR